MATTAYRNWDRTGRPWKVAAPMQAIGSRLRAYGYVVYFLGADDSSHLQANTPEDHCPFSYTGWPIAHPYPYVTAFDVMPPKTGSGLPTLQQLGAQMVADRNAGHPGLAWLKYMNWETQRDWSGPCYQDSWKPGYSRKASNDRGHIHASGRSDMVTVAGAAATYDPVARIRGGTTQGEDMDGNQDRLLRSAEWRLHHLLQLDPTAESDPFGGTYNIPLVDLLKRVDENVAALLAKPAAAVTDAQAAAIADKVGKALVDRPDNPLGKADLPAIVAGVQEALRQGVPNKPTS